MSNSTTTILTLDPSSTLCGYAFGEIGANLDRPRLIDAGRLKGSEKRLSSLDERFSDLVNSAPLAACRRVLSIGSEAAALVQEHKPCVVIVEIPSGLFGTAAKRGASGSLTTYGYAAGVIFERVRVEVAYLSGDAIPVTERIWTRWRGRKEDWAIKCELLFRGQYKRETDPRRDVADAIGLLCWASAWFRMDDTRRALWIGQSRKDSGWKTGVSA